MTNTNWRNFLIAFVIVIIGAIAAGYYMTHRSNVAANPSDGQVAGESEDDGSSVADGVPVSRDVKIGETKSIAGVRINPTKVEEDSRCPTGVQCIQAGTVRVSTMVTGRDEAAAQPVMFEIGVPMTVGLDQITLVKVMPDKNADTPITAGDYVFTFTVVKGGGSEFYKG